MNYPNGLNEALKSHEVKFVATSHSELEKQIKQLEAENLNLKEANEKLEKEKNELINKYEGYTCECRDNNCNKSMIIRTIGFVCEEEEHRELITIAVSSTK